MALSIPNNLVFVPLDVLTAEELNKLMADINYIANQFPITSGNIGSGAIGSSQLASSAVTNSKFNYSDVLNAVSTQSTPGTSVLQSYGNYASVSIASFPTSSKILAFATANYTGASDVTGILGKLVCGSQSSPEFSQTNTWGKHIAIMWMFTKPSGQSYLYYQTMKDNTSNATLSSISMGAIRVG